VDQADRAEALVGLPLIDVDGRTVGIVDEIFYSRRTGAPGFAVVRDVAVPLDRAELGADAIVVPYTREDIDRGPALDADLDSATAERVRAHFAGRELTADATTARVPVHAEAWEPAAAASGEETTIVAPVESLAEAPAPHEPPSPTEHAGADDTVEVDLHEEQLAVDTRRTAAERVVLRKRIVTDEVTISVTVRREELVIEREPVEDGDVPGEATGDRRLEEGELEFLLYQEEPVVTTRVVPSERVRVRREAIPEERVVTGELRREKAEVEQSRHPGGT
jgi:uncharacterized protein (TIGR02271 family)